MHQTRALPLSRVVSALTSKTARRQATPAAWVLCAQKCQSSQTIHTGSPWHVTAANNVKPSDGVINKFLKSTRLLNFSRSKLRMSGYLLYESVADTINYTKFFTEFHMPDTFFSWFIVTELHVWMLMVRCMNEGDDGRFTRNSIVEAMWADVFTRSKNLGASNPSGTRTQVQELSQQFNAAIIGYDEGLLGDDKVLAGALWRRFFQLECNNPEHIEKLVNYIRKQLHTFDKLSSETFLFKPDIKWMDFEDC